MILKLAKGKREAGQKDWEEGLSQRKEQTLQRHRGGPCQGRGCKWSSEVGLWWGGRC